MKVGINGTGLVQKASVDAVVRHARSAADDGFASYWLAEHPTGGFDALTVLALVGQVVPDIELGTAIVPTMPRHPLVLAGQALTTAASIDHRLTLGIGLLIGKITGLLRGWKQHSSAGFAGNRAKGFG
jgi:alkanesulfonate monooxygenase SsuD/methylene tetrahydromethanopterin reductase-like flavin-dependent oxidoreductase (luciferase family)